MTQPGAARSADIASLVIRPEIPSIAGLGIALDRGDPANAPEELFNDREVLAAETASLFFAAPTLAGHASQLSCAGDRIVIDVAMRAYLLVRGHGGRLFAFRNRCLHTGYPICAAEAPGSGGRLVCQYHGWTYALTGELLEPSLPVVLAKDRPALSPVAAWEQTGLLVVDPATRSGTAGPRLEAWPDWVADAAIVDQRSIESSNNWKHLHWRLDGLLSGTIPGVSATWASTALGWLSWLVVDESSRAVLIVRLMPRSTDRTGVSCSVLRTAGNRRGEPAAADRVAAFLLHRLGDEPQRMPVASDARDADPEAAAAHAFLTRYRAALRRGPTRRADAGVTAVTHSSR